MPFIPSTDITHVEIDSIITVAAAGSDAKRFDNKWNYRRTANILAVSKTQVETAFQAAIMVPLMASLSSRATQARNDVRWIDDAGDAPQSFTRAVVGAIAGDSMTGRTAVTMELKTGLRGRSGRGSKHFGPIAETSVDGDCITAAALVLFDVVRDAMLLGFTDAGGNVWVPEVVIRNRDPENGPSSQLRVNPTTVLSNDVLSIIINTTVGTMNRRRVARVTG